MRPHKTTIVLLALLLANTGAILCFRYFTTIDGPLHVLRASLLDPRWITQGHVAHGMVYETTGWTWRLGDLTLAALLRVCSPERAHDVFAVLVNGCVLFAALAFLRAHGTRVGLAVLWSAPLTLSFVLGMGLFHFMLGAAVSLATVAWWKWHEHSPRWRWTGLLVGVFLAWQTHRGAPIILCACFLASFLVERMTTRSHANDKRRTLLLLSVSVGAVLLVVALVWQRLVMDIPLPTPRVLPAFDEDLLIRPFILLDPEQERWTVLPLALLLLIAVCSGTWARIRMGRGLFQHDPLLLLILVFQLIAWLGHSPYGRQLLIAERAEWLALLFLVLWLAAVADARRGHAAVLIGITALLALPLHVIRIVQMERSLFELKPARDGIIEAGENLAPGSLAMPVNVGRNALLQHLDAYIAAHHSGILISSNNAVPIDVATQADDQRILRMAHDPHWVARHWREGLPTEVDQVLFLGGDIERAVSKHPWPVLLGTRFRVTFDNGYARIYSAFPVQ